MNYKKVLLFTFLSCILVACGNNQKAVEVNKDGEQMAYVQEDDQSMNEAITKAQSTYNDFLKVFKENQNNPNFDSFTIKIGFNSPKFGKEHMWVSDLHFDKDTLKGVLANTPEDESISFKPGDFITINPSEISDWMYIEIKGNKDNKAITHGGYTIRAIRDKMSDEEKASFDEENGLNFED